MHGAIQNSNINNICLPPPRNHSTPASVSSILPQSSSDIDTDHGEFINKAIKQAAQSINQSLLKTPVGNPTSNLTPNIPSQHKTPDRQIIPTFNPSDVHTQTKTQPTHTYRPVSAENSITHSVTNFKQTKQVIMDIDALSHSPALCNKIFQELNLNGLCLYNNTHQAYLFRNSNKIVNCNYIPYILKQSTCYTITPDTHQWYRIYTYERTGNHKIALCNDSTVHMVSLQPAEPLEVHAFKTVTRLTFQQTQNNYLNNTHTQPIYSSSTPN